jgi:diphthamide biosynthesis protein 7
MVNFDTVFPADSLEFCPTIGYQDIFVCGTYNLLEQSPSQSESGEVGSGVAQNRRGQCLVFRTNPREDNLLCGHL